MYKILSVDDDPINQAIVEELLSTIYDIALASSGEECIQNISSIKPALVLLDVSMTGMDGYETCRELKKDENTRHIPVIFISAHGSLEDKIKAYEAGGHDYISKPFNHSELELKIKHTIKTNKQSISLAKQNNQPSHNISTAAVRNNEDTEIIIQFLAACCTSTSLDDLGELLLNSCQDLELNCALQFRTRIGKRSFSTKNDVSPLEHSLFEQTINRERFFDFSAKIIITYPHISLLVKNMPAKDTARYNELKYIFETLMKGTESRIKTLINSQ